MLKEGYTNLFDIACGYTPRSIYCARAGIDYMLEYKVEEQVQKKAAVIRDYLTKEVLPLDSRLNYAISFTTVGTIEMAAKWIRDGYQIEPEEMIEYQLMCCPEILRPFLEPEEKA